MLSSVLKKETCAQCRFCCSFRRTSLWETELFPMEFVEKYQGRARFDIREIRGMRCGQLHLIDQYQTEDPDEEVPCTFLNGQAGCTLSEEEKPFDCRIWPLRVMETNGHLAVTLELTCPAINQVGQDRMRELVKGGLGEKIYAYAHTHPFIVKELTEGFAVLDEEEGRDVSAV